MHREKELMIGRLTIAAALLLLTGSAAARDAPLSSADDALRERCEEIAPGLHNPERRAATVEALISLACIRVGYTISPRHSKLPFRSPVHPFQTETLPTRASWSAVRMISSSAMASCGQGKR